MGGEQDGFAFLQQHLQPLPHQVARLRVQARGGLVQHQQLRLVDEGARQAQAPFHAARQLARFGFGLVAERTKLQQLRNAFADHGIGDAEVAAKHQQVFFCREVRVQRVHLRDHAQAGLDGQGVSRHLQTVEITDFTAIGLRQAQAHAQRGGFARTVGADHAQAFTGLDVERQVVDHRGVAIAFDQVFDREQRGFHAPDCALPPGGICRSAASAPT